MSKFTKRLFSFVGICTGLLVVFQNCTGGFKGSELGQKDSWNDFQFFSIGKPLIDLTNHGRPADLDYRAKKPEFGRLYKTKSLSNQRNLASESISQKADPGEMETIATITTNVTNANIVGIGINIAHSDYHYVSYGDNKEISQEWGPHSQHLPHPDDDIAWKRYYRMLDFIDPQFVRIGTSTSLFEPKNDDNDPNHINPDGFVWGPNFETNSIVGKKQHLMYLRALHRLLEKFDDTGAYVQITNWRLGRDTFAELVNGKPQIWLSNKVHQGQNISADEAISDEPYDINEFTENIAATLDYLINKSGHNSIQAVSVLNEPEGMIGDIAKAKGITPEAYLAQIYNSLHLQLKSVSLDQKVDIIGFDGSGLWFSQSGFDSNRAGKLISLTGNAVGAIGLHNYTSDFDYKAPGPYASFGGEGGREEHLQGSIQEHLIDNLVTPIQRDIASSNKDIKILFGELGSHSYPANLEGSDDNFSGGQSFLQRLHNAEATIKLLNVGVKGIAFWTLNANTHKKWRALTYPYQSTRDASQNNYSVPITQPETFYPLALLTKFVKKGSDVYNVELEGGVDSQGKQRIHISQIRNQNKITFLIVNDDTQERSIRFDNFSADLLGLYVSESQHQKIYNMGTLNPSEGFILPPQSLMVLTNRDGESSTVYNIEENYSEDCPLGQLFNYETSACEATPNAEVTQCAEGKYRNPNNPYECIKVEAQHYSSRGSVEQLACPATDATNEYRNFSGQASGATTQSDCFQCRQGFGNINIQGKCTFLNGSPASEQCTTDQVKVGDQCLPRVAGDIITAYSEVLNRSSQDPNDSGYEDATSNWYLKNRTSTALQTIRKEMALSTEGRGLIAGKFTAKIVNRSVTEDDYKSVAAILKTPGQRISDSPTISDLVNSWATRVCPTDSYQINAQKQCEAKTTQLQCSTTQVNFQDQCLPKVASEVITAYSEVLNRSTQDPNDNGYEGATMSWYEQNRTSTALQIIRKEMALSTEGRGLIAGKFTTKILNRTVTEEDYKSVAEILKDPGQRISNSTGITTIVDNWVTRVCPTEQYFINSQKNCELKPTCAANGNTATSTRGLMIIELYQRILARNPLDVSQCDATGFNFYYDSGKSCEAMALSILSDSEFQNKIVSGKSLNKIYMQTVYRAFTTLTIPTSDPGIIWWADQISNGTYSRTNVLSPLYEGLKSDIGAWKALGAKILCQQ